GPVPPWSRTLHCVPGREDEPGGAVFAEAAHPVGLEHAEGLGRVVRALHVGRVADVAQLGGGKTVFAGIEGVQFGAQMRAAILIQGERWTVVTQVAREWRHGMAGVGEFDGARDDESKIGGRKGGGYRHWKLKQDEKIQGCSSDLLASA